MTLQGISVLLVLVAAWIPTRRALEVSDASAAGFLAAASARSAAPKEAVECPFATYNTHTNRYEVEPVSQRIRAKLELRQRIAGKAHCSGPLVTAPGEVFSFEAVHFRPRRGVWQGVLAALPELEKAAHAQPTQVFEVCVVSSKICVAHLEPPPQSSFLDKFGFWVPRERSPWVRTCFRWAFAVVAIYVVTVVSGVLAVPRLLKTIGFADDKTSGEQDETEQEDPPDQRKFIEGIPTSFSVILKAVSSLGLFASTALSLILVCYYFIYQREVVDSYARILNYGPVVLMMCHVIVLWRSTCKTLLYNGMLRGRMHIIFNERAPLYSQPVVMTALAIGVIMLFSGFMTIAADARQMQCTSDSADATTSGECMSFFSVVMYIGISIWGLIFPVSYCLYLIYTDDNFEKILVPLYTIYETDGEAMSELGKTVSIAYTTFVAAATKRCASLGVNHVTFRWARTFAEESSKGQLHRPSSQPKVEGIVEATREDFTGIFSLWSWRLRLRHSQARSLELRIMLALGLGTMCLTILMAVLAEIFRLTLIPELTEIAPSLGQLSPEFDPHIFNYNLFIDHHVKSGSLEVIANKNRVSQVALNLQGDQEVAVAPWTEATKNVHVPFFVRNAFEGNDDAQAKVYSDSHNAPVPIQLHVHGAGTTFVYTITVIKLETRISSMEYRYNTSSTVHEVVVRKEVDWEKLMQAEAVDEEAKEFSDPDTQGAAVYVPIDTQVVTVKMERNLAVYGPAGNTVLSNFEVDEFKAARTLVLCPPKAGNGKCEKQSGASRVKVQEDVTALPVELRPNGTDPLKFMVNIIRVANRLINLDLEAPMRKVAGGTGWGEMPLLPVFRPLVDSYETFFQVPDEHGGDEKDEKQVLFLRVRPQGNSLTNWVEAEVVPNSDSGTELALFCRPAEDDDSDPLDPTLAVDTEDLECGATADQAHDPEEGKPTEDLIIRDKRTGLAFREHFFIRYKYNTSQPAPFTMFLRVSFLEHALEGAVANIQHRVYEVKFLPQAPMRLELSAPFMESPRSAFIEAVEHHASQSTRAPDLPLFLSPAFRSDILHYTAVLPRNTDPSVLVRLLQSHSLWASGGGGPLRGLGQGAELQQEVKLQHGPDCALPDEGLAQAPALPSYAPAPAPMPEFIPSAVQNRTQPAMLQTTSDIGCVQIRIYERREGFPRTYTVHLREAQPDQVLLAGMLQNGSSALPEPLPGFQPAENSFNSSLKDLEWNWGPPSPAPLPPAPAPASVVAAAPAAATEAADESALMPLAFSAAAAAAKAMAQDPALRALSHKSIMMQRLGQPPWTGEPLPAGVIAVLAAAKTAYLTAEWNGLLLPTARAGGPLWHTTFAGKVLVEACWCDREQLLNNCLTRLTARAPSATQRFYRPNACRLTFKIDGQAVQDIKVGHAWEVVDGALLDQAADAAEKIEVGAAEKRRVGKVSSLLQSQVRGSTRASGTKMLSAPLNSADQLLLPPSFSADKSSLSPSFSPDELLLPPV
mmetsp:Transcript_13387/g.24960  ORF Transcript_13387/g.24960 Transcript_13387/m.24960 type:complete len:1488 (-) Transcript_13387:46-4509(-)